MSDDLIKREDAIKAIHPKARLAGGSVAIEYADMFQDALKSLPSADRPQGEWIVDMPNYKSVCSVCGANETDFIYGTEMWYGLGESKFCPSCGARMKGADDETN